MAIWAATSLTGGTFGALDNIPVAELSDGHRALAITSSGVYHYTLDATSGATESSPDVIKPDDTTGDERWLLEEIHQDLGDLNNVDTSSETDEYVLTYNSGTGNWEAQEARGYGKVLTKSSAYTMSAGEYVHADTSGGAFTISCPSSPSDGDFIGIRDKASNFASNNLTLDGNGQNILGDSTFTFDVDDQPADFEFNADRNEWIFARR